MVKSKQFLKGSIEGLVLLHNLWEYRSLLLYRAKRLKAYRAAKYRELHSDLRKQSPSIFNTFFEAPCIACDAIIKVTMFLVNPAGAVEGITTLRKLKNGEKLGSKESTHTFPTLNTGVGEFATLGTLGQDLVKSIIKHKATPLNRKYKKVLTNIIAIKWVGKSASYCTHGMIYEVEHSTYNYTKKEWITFIGDDGTEWVYQVKNEDGTSHIAERNKFEIIYGRETKIMYNMGTGSILTPECLHNPKPLAAFSIRPPF